MKKVVETILVVAAILLAIWLAGAVFSVGINLLHLVGSIFAMVIHFLFSKSVLTLVLVGTIIYFMINPKKLKRNGYHS